MDRVNQLLQEKEAEIENVVQAERATIQSLKERLEVLEEEKKVLQVRAKIFLINRNVLIGNIRKCDTTEMIY